MGSKEYIFGQGDEMEELCQTDERTPLTYPEASLPQHEDPDYDPRIESLGVKLANAELNRQRTHFRRQIDGDHTVIIEEGKHKRDYIEINENFEKGHNKAVFSIYQEMATPLTKTNAPGTEEEMGYERIPDEAGKNMANAILQELRGMVESGKV